MAEPSPSSSMEPSSPGVHLTSSIESIEDHDGTNKLEVVIFHLYDPKVMTSLFRGLELSPCQLNSAYDYDENLVVETYSRGSSTSIPVYSISTKTTCSLCNCNFSTRQQQMDHYKLDWHRFNLKQKMAGSPTITEAQFESISGDVSSISGSEISSDDDNDGDRTVAPPLVSDDRLPSSRNEPGARSILGSRRHPKVFFRNGDKQLISIHRCLLHGKKDAPATTQQLVTMATQLPLRMTWLILMMGGGHFAGAIFEGKEITVHKTFHRYTVRAKRGTAQGIRDSQHGGHQPKSAGASLRRYNESALSEEIRTLLDSWHDRIQSCHRIFVRAPSHNKSALFGDKNPPLSQKDVRIATIPFATRRPTHKEIKRVHELLATVICYGDVMQAEKHMLSSSQRQSNSKPKDRALAPTRAVLAGNAARNVNNEDRVVDDGEDDGDEVELVLVEEEMSTLELQEHETCIEKSKRPKRKRKAKKKMTEKSGEQNKLDSTEAALCNACSTGDWDHLRTLLVSSTTQWQTTSDSQDQPIQDLAQQTTEENSLTAEMNGGESVKLDTRLPESSGPVGSDETVTSRQSCHGESLLNCEKSPTDRPPPEDCLMSPVNPQVGTVSIEAVINRPVCEDGGTLLQLAVGAQDASLVWKLLEAGADPSISNTKGKLPYVLCNDKKIRNEFRRFMAAHPDRYNYEKAQVPSPLTSNMEEFRTAKAAGKRKTQKLNKRIRDKERKLEEQKQAEIQRKQDEEDAERRRFTSLSDRERRALAAEKRFQAQVMETVTTEATMKNIKRCWVCGASLVNTIPFEYLDYKFCTMKCLKEHKQLTKSATK